MVAVHRSGVYGATGHGRFGQVASEPEPPELTPAGGGFTYPITRSHPRTCAAMLPATVPVEVDGNKRAVVKVEWQDVNRDGEPNEGDAILLEPISVVVIGSGVRLVLSEDLLLAMCQRIANGL